MPVHSRGDKKETNHHDEMEVDYAENEGSSSEDEDTESSSVSEDGDSSEMDDEDCERRRMECLDEMSNLEKQFTDLKDQEAQRRDESAFNIWNCQPEIRQISLPDESCCLCHFWC